MVLPPPDPRSFCPQLNLLNAPHPKQNSWVRHCFQQRFSCSLNFFRTGLEVLTFVKINNAIWVRSSCSMVHVYGCFRGAIWVYLERPSEDGGCMY